MLKSGMKALDALSIAAESIVRESDDQPRRQAEWMIESILGIERSDLYTERDLKLNKKQTQKLQEFIERRQKGEPLQYILGTAPFRNITLDIDSRALIPRPETEGLVEIGLKLVGDIPAPNILDIGTGSGAIALSILDEHPKANVIGIDASQDSLMLAEKNAQKLGLGERLSLREADLYSDDFLSDYRDYFDLIITNPPYVSQREYWELPGEIRLYEPETALIAAEDGLAALNTLARKAHHLLKTGQYLVCEIGETQASKVLRYYQTIGWDTYIRNDLNRKPRYLVASLKATTPESIWWGQS